MACVPLRSAPIRLFMLVWAICGPWVRGDLAPEKLAAAKSATAWVETSEGAQTAVCIAETGIYVTAEHLLKKADPDSLILEINPDGGLPQRLPAKLLRRYQEDGLALLKVETGKKLPTLPFGDDSKLENGQSMEVVGFRLGEYSMTLRAPAGEAKLKSGEIRGLHAKSGVIGTMRLALSFIEEDAGAPMLDTEGKLMGMLAWGNGRNEVLPVSKIRKIMAAPLVFVQPPQVGFAKRFEDADFVIAIECFKPPTNEPAVSIELSTGGVTRHSEARKQGDGKYLARIAPLPKGESDTQFTLHATFIFNGKQVNGMAADEKVVVAGKKVLLSSLHVVEPSSDRKALMADGQELEPWPELAALPLSVDGQMIKVDARPASRMIFSQRLPEIPSVATRVIIRDGNGGEFATEKGALWIDPPVLPATPEFLQRAEVEKQLSISLPGYIGDLAVAQGGRTLLFLLRDVKKVAVFDVPELKIRGYINLPEEDVSLAAGSRYILLVSQRMVFRYSADTLVQEAKVKNRWGRNLGVVMGFSAPNLALISTQSPESRLISLVFDAETMKEVAVAKRGPELHGQIRASADGNAFAVCEPGLSPMGFQVLKFRDGIFSLFTEHSTDGILVPNADGSLIFTGKSGVMTDRHVPVLELNGQAALDEQPAFLPSYVPSVWVAVPARPGDRKSSWPPRIYFSDDKEMACEAPEVLPEMNPKTLPKASEISDLKFYDKRYHFYPQLNLLLTIPPSNDRVVVRSLNLVKILNAQRKGYLFVTSTPPIGEAAQRYQYQIKAASSGGGVQYSLETGPSGLTVSKDGLVDWIAPPNAADEAVVVSVKDKAGRETLSTFHVVVTK